MLGRHVAQKGSLVSPERLRFDFSHTKPMSPAELAAVEAMANAVLMENSPVVTRLMALDDARDTRLTAVAANIELLGETIQSASVSRGVLPLAIFAGSPPRNAAVYSIVLFSGRIFAAGESSKAPFLIPEKNAAMPQKSACFQSAHGWL